MLFEEKTLFTSCFKGKTEFLDKFPILIYGIVCCIFIIIYLYIILK